MAGMANGHVRLSQTSPAFLHANSTSHTWTFSAFAEIIDNAYDPDVSASQLYIDVEDRLGEKCLIFMDNGNGMNQDKLHKMLSFGYCEKIEIDGHKPVGHYGNGFKSGSMRLGKDAIVFTKNSQTMSVGFLSQSYLRDVGATTVLVPMVSWNVKTKRLIHDDSTDDSLEAITLHSLFRTEGDLLDEFKEMELMKTGTRIIIYNLKRGNDDRLEMDFNSDNKDIRNSERMELDFATTLRPVLEHVPEYKRSLREYCSILFLKPRMKIILRGSKVKTKLISKSLLKTEKDFYKPMYLTKPVKIIFGFNSSENDFGLMMYHRNRLIKAYEHVGCQKQANNHGVGVVGVVEVDFLEPIHNKQDFNKTDRYNASINSIGQKLNDYWYTKTSNQPPGNAVSERKKADWTWVQCENCLKWRRLPDGFTDEGLADKWYCYMNPDPTHNQCDVDEEPEDEDELQARASYSKVKKKSEPRLGKVYEEVVVKKEQELLEKERALFEMQQNLQQSLEPLAPTGARGRQPCLADLEAAQKELERARRREEDQRTYIKQLTQQRKQILNGQQVVRSNVATSGNINVLNNIAKSGETRTVDLANGKRKKQTKERITIPGGDAIITRNESSSDEEPAPKKGPLVVKLHVKKKKPKPVQGVIVIDSDDDGELEISAGPRSVSPIDIKPDITLLDREMETSTATVTNTPRASLVKSSHGITNSPSSFVKASPGPSPSRSTVPSVMKTSGPSSSKVTGPIPPKPTLPSTPKSTGPVPQKSTGPSTPKSTPTAKSPTVGVAKDRLQENEIPPVNKKTNNPSHCKNTVHRQSQTLPVEVKGSKSSASQNLEGDSKNSLELTLTKLEEAKSQLTSLRTNVGKLLRTILPDLQVDNLEFIDAIVKEMVRVNKDGKPTNKKLAANSELSRKESSQNKASAKQEISIDLESEPSTELVEKGNVFNSKSSETEKVSKKPVTSPCVTDPVQSPSENICEASISNPVSTKTAQKQPIPESSETEPVQEKAPSGTDITEPTNNEPKPEAANEVVLDKPSQSEETDPMAENPKPDASNEVVPVKPSQSDETDPVAENPKPDASNEVVPVKPVSESDETDCVAENPSSPKTKNTDTVSQTNSDAESTQEKPICSNVLDSVEDKPAAESNMNESVQDKPTAEEPPTDEPLPEQSTSELNGDEPMEKSLPDTHEAETPQDQSKSPTSESSQDDSIETMQKDSELIDTEPMQVQAVSETNIADPGQNDKQDDAFCSETKQKDSELSNTEPMQVQAVSETNVADPGQKGEQEDALLSEIMRKESELSDTEPMQVQETVSETNGADPGQTDEQDDAPRSETMQKESTVNETEPMQVQETVSETNGADPGQNDEQDDARCSETVQEKSQLNDTEHMQVQAVSEKNGTDPGQNDEQDDAFCNETNKHSGDKNTCADEISDEIAIEPMT